MLSSEVTNNISTTLAFAQGKIMHFVNDVFSPDARTLGFPSKYFHSQQLVGSFHEVARTTNMGYDVERKRTVHEFSQGEIGSMIWKQKAYNESVHHKIGKLVYDHGSVTRFTYLPVDKFMVGTPVFMMGMWDKNCELIMDRNTPAEIVVFSSFPGRKAWVLSRDYNTNTDLVRSFLHKYDYQLSTQYGNEMLDVKIEEISSSSSDQSSDQSSSSGSGMGCTNGNNHDYHCNPFDGMVSRLHHNSSCSSDSETSCSYTGPIEKIKRQGSCHDSQSDCEETNESSQSSQSCEQSVSASASIIPSGQVFVTLTEEKMTPVLVQGENFGIFTQMK